MEIRAAETKQYFIDLFNVYKIRQEKDKTKVLDVDESEWVFRNSFYVERR